MGRGNRGPRNIVTTLQLNLSQFLYTFMFLEAHGGVWCICLMFLEALMDDCGGRCTAPQAVRTAALRNDHARGSSSGCSSELSWLCCPGREV